MSVYEEFVKTLSELTPYVGISSPGRFTVESKVSSTFRTRNAIYLFVLSLSLNWT